MRKNFRLDSDEEDEAPRPRRSSASRHKRQADVFIDLCLPSPEAHEPPLAKHGAPSAAVQDAPAAPATGCAGAEGLRSKPVSQRMCSKAPAAPAPELTAGAACKLGPSKAGKGQPTRALKQSAGKGAAAAAKLRAVVAKQLRAEHEALGTAVADAAASVPQATAGEQAAGVQLGSGKSGAAAAAKPQAAGSKRPSPVPDAQGGRKKRKKAESAEAPAAEARPPPADFFLSASQKRAKREADAAAAREAERAAAAEQQRKRAEAGIGLADGCKPHPFWVPRPAAAARASGGSRQSSVPAGPQAPLPPALPAIHVLQASEDAAVPMGWAPRRARVAQAPATVVSMWQDVERVDPTLYSVFMRRPAGVQRADAEGASGAALDTMSDIAAAQPAEQAPANALWTDKYRPGSAEEVCGNGTAAAELRAWLQEWRPRRARATREAALIGSESDGEWCQGAQDVLDSDEEDGADCGGAAWISGSVGSGKTAAVAAVAQELGLQVLEVNPGSERTGALVTRAVGEATQSCRLARANAESVARTVVVFEEVDNLADEDRGFLAALSTIIADSKRPIVLMSNAAALPPALAGAHLRHMPFQRPAPSAAARTLAGVCVAEGRPLVPAALHALVLRHRCDLRRCLLEAQVHFRSAARALPEPVHPQGALSALHQALRNSLSSQSATASAASAPGAAHREDLSPAAADAALPALAPEQELSFASGPCAAHAGGSLGLERCQGGADYCAGNAEAAAEPGGRQCGVSAARQAAVWAGASEAAACAADGGRSASCPAADPCMREHGVSAAHDAAVWAGAEAAAVADLLLQSAGAAEARAAEDPSSTGVLACSSSPSAESAAALLDAALVSLTLRACASQACPRPYPSPAGAAAHAAHDTADADPVQAMACGVHAELSSGTDPLPSPGADGAWATTAAAATWCEAAWACAGGGGAAGRLARAERLHAAARMAWLERVREHADSMTAGGRMRRRRGFRSYITSTLALPQGAAASLALVGSSLAARHATAVDAS